MSSYENWIFFSNTKCANRVESGREIRADRPRKARNRAISPVTRRISRARTRRLWVVWWRKVCSPRRSWTCDHLQRGEITWQVTNAAAPIKAMKERGWDRRLVVPQRGPTTKAEPSVGGFPPFVPAFRFFCVCPRRSRPQGPAVRAETPEPTGPSCFASKRKSKKGTELASPLFVSAPRGGGEVECRRCRRWTLLVIAGKRTRESEESICE